MLLLPKFQFLLFIIFYLPFVAFNQVSSSTLKHYQNLCSEEFAGRGYVNNGIYTTQNYILNYLKDSLNLKPLFGNQTYTQNFSHPVNTFTKNIEIILKGKKQKKLIAGIDFLVHPGSNSYHNDSKIYFLDTIHFNNKNQLIKILSNLPKNTVIICKSGVTNNKTFYKEITQYYQQNFKNKCIVFLQTKKLTWGVLPIQFNNCILDVLEEKFDTAIHKIKINVEANFINEFPVSNIGAANKDVLPNDSCIVICAHYDHLGKMGQNTTFFGANDNASGVAMLLDLAKHFNQFPTKYPIVYIAFTAEELGLFGSKFFIENLPQTFKIKLVINLDMVSAGENGLTIANANHNTTVFDELNTINTNNNYLPQLVSKNGSANSDHYFFHEAGFPAIFIYALGNYTHYHDIEDKLENLNLQFYPKTLNLLSDFILKINGRN
jgi:aminopeptidase YwaD